MVFELKQFTYNDICMYEYGQESHNNIHGIQRIHSSSQDGEALCHPVWN